MSTRENGQESQEQQKTRVVVMLGARFVQQGEGNGLPPQFPLVLESKKEGMPKEVVGGDVRMRAIEQLYKEFTQAGVTGSNFRVFTTGGVESIDLPNGETLKLSRAEMAEEKLERKYGLPEDIVETLPSGGSTLGNAAVLVEWVRDHTEEFGDMKEIEIVTNEFHMPRAWLMFSLAVYKNKMGSDLALSAEDMRRIENVADATLGDMEHGDQEFLKELQNILSQYLTDANFVIKPQIAEEVLKRRGASGVKYGELIRHNQYLQETRGFERQGVKDLIHGKYQVK